MQWESVIGLEIHVQLKTRSKIFSGASTAFGAPPNAQACVIDLGFPGVLPVLNGVAVWMTVRFGVAIDATIARRSVFARKNYFYPDLPKGYQISQYEMPIVQDGHLTIDSDDSTTRRVRIRRAHLEEDAGKSLHQDFAGLSGIDLNRAGIPLLEIVSDPDLRSAREAVAYMKKIHRLVRYLDICDGNMQEGSFRCDANVSVRRLGSDELGTRTELKNLNSFRFVERAINYEIRRQIERLEDGRAITQETRLYDPEEDETRPLRGKEEAHDYRYFPDPDLLPLELSQAYVDEVRAGLPELPDAKRLRFCREYGLGPEDADALSASREVADYFDSTVRAAAGSAKACANWIMGDLMAALNRNGWDISRSPVTPAMLGAMIKRVADDTISGRSAKEVFQAMWDGAGEADHIIASRRLRQLTDDATIEGLVAEVIASNPEQAAQYRAGKSKVLGFLVGQVMKLSHGKADPKQVNELLRSQLRGGSPDP